MKHLSFEDFLMDYHCRTNSEILDDDLPDAYGDWLANLDSDEWIALGDKYLKEQKSSINDLSDIELLEILTNEEEKIKGQKNFGLANQQINEIRRALSA